MGHSGEGAKSLEEGPRKGENSGGVESLRGLRLAWKEG